MWWDPGAATTNSTRLRAAGEVAAREHFVKACASVGSELWIHEQTASTLNARAKFDEEIEEGLMEKVSPETFKERFGENTAIAALAVIVEDEEKDKKRLIHDATHGVRVNHRIKCRDKVRAPGAHEKKQLLLEAMDRKEIPFSMVGDIKKAHRRFKHLAKEQGLLACQLDSREGPVGS